MLSVTELNRLGILGGTFDPVHLGHVDAASAVRRALRLAEVRLIPTRVTPHRTREPQASAGHRLAMVELAVEGMDGLSASAVELRSEDPSYTSLMLEKLSKTGLQPWQLFFITGADAFAEIATWHNYPDVLDRSHFVVVSRKGLRASDLPRQLPDLASRIRHPNRADGRQPYDTTGIWLVDHDTRDISSSDVRWRLALGQSIDGLVNRSVSAYISRHHLYARVEADDTLHD